jgi:hypothetical protein
MYLSSKAMEGHSQFDDSFALLRPGLRRPIL